MNDLSYPAAVLLTLLPVACCAALGYRLGTRRLLAAWIARAIAIAGAVGVVSSGYRSGWFQPFGLATPLLCGVVTGLLIHGLARRRLATFMDGAGALRISRRSRTGGALLGAAGGSLAAASLWLLLLLVLGASSSLRAGRANAAFQRGAGGGPAPSWLESLVRTANRGLVRHLPVVGGLGDEVESLVTILNTPPEVREALALRNGWQELAELPTFQAILDDAELLEDLAALSRGNLAALYRLQKNPRVLAFFAEEQVQRLVRELRPSAITRQLEAIQLARR